MRILQEAAKKEIVGTGQKKAKGKTSSDVDIIEVSDRDPTAGWRRLGIRALAVVNMAQKQVMIQELAQVTIEKASIPDDMAKTPKAKQQGVGVTKAEIMLRTPLKPSKAFYRVGSFDAKECQHRWLVPRGGKTHWYTCRTCPMRWPREKDEYCKDVDTIAPDARGSLASQKR